MAVSKFSLFFIAIIFASNYSPACGQPAVRTPADFWITFGQQLTTNVLSWLLNLDIIPDDLLNELNAQPAIVPTPAPINPNQIRISFVNGQPVILPSNAVLPSVAPLVPAPQPTPAQADPTMLFWKLLWDLHGTNKNTPAPVPLPVPGLLPTTPSPCTTTAPICQGPECKPEKVRIVVVDDCKNHKGSSESCSEESSEEIDVIVPRKKYPKWH